MLVVVIYYIYLFRYLFVFVSLDRYRYAGWFQLGVVPNSQHKPCRCCLGFFPFLTAPLVDSPASCITDIPHKWPDECCSEAFAQVLDMIHLQLCGLFILGAFLLKDQIALQINELLGCVENIVQMLPNIDFVKGISSCCL